MSAHGIVDTGNSGHQISVGSSARSSAHEPLSVTPEPGRGVAEGHELLDTGPLTVWTPNPIEETIHSPAVVAASAARILATSDCSLDLTSQP